jgi:hypothetical protein
VAIEDVEHPAPIRRERNPILPVPEKLPLPVPAPTGPRRRRIDRTAHFEPPPAPEPIHDPHLASSGPLPASVLIGLALLPFAIPILWLIAPAVTGVEPAMSIATPSALALAASVLCLAVIYTIDWTPTTRIKGVLMLVGLAYFGAVSVYFLKREMVERIKRFTGLEERVRWRDFNTPDYRIQFPGTPEPLDGPDEPLASLKLKYFTAAHEHQFLGRYRFICGALRLGAVNDVNLDQLGSPEWYKKMTREIVTRSGGQQSGEASEVEYPANWRGRQLLIHFPDRGTFRVVRLYVIRGTVYYLSVEGTSVDADDELARVFFNSFQAQSLRP